MISLVDFLALFTCIMLDLVGESAVLGYKFCSVCKLCYFTIHLVFHSPGPQICFYASHELIFLNKPFMGGWKVHFFYDTVTVFAFYGK